MSKKSKFILTKNEKTADELENQGFTLINFSNGTFVFLNDSDIRMNFSKLEKKSYTFTNNMYF